MKPTFRDELRDLLNRHSKENGSNTPDWILADYLLAALEAFDVANRARERWYAPDGLVPADEQTRHEQETTL